MMLLIDFHLHATVLALYLALGAWIVVARQHQKMQRVFLELIGCFTLWSAAEVGIALSRQLETAHFFYTAGSVGWILAPGMFLFFTLAYTDQSALMRSLRLHSAVWPGVIVLLILSFSGHLGTVEMHAGGWRNHYHGITIWLYLLYAFIASGYACVHLMRYLGQTNNRIKRIRTYVIFAAAACSMIPTITTEVIMPLAGVGLPLRIGPLFTLLWMGAVAWIMLRYRFLYISTEGIANSIILTMKEALFLVSPEEFITRCNTAAVGLTGYPEQELLKKKPADLFMQHSDPLRLPDEADSHDFHETECTVLTADGEARTALISRSLIQNTEGEKIGHILTARDITTIKNAEKLLSERNIAIDRERENLRLIFESAQVGLVLLQKDGIVVRANNAIAGAVGKDAADMIGKLPGEALCCAVIASTGDRCGTTSHCPACPVRNLFTLLLEGQGEIRDVEFCKEFVILGKPVTLWFDINGRRLEIDGQPHALLSIVDVTSRKTLELSLAKARDDAESAALVKSEFLANMSHELRTPLNGIIGMLSLITGSGLSDELRQYIEVARTSGESLLTIINDILDFSRIEAKKLSLDPVPFDLRTLIEDTACLLAAKAHEKGLELNSMISPDVPSWVTGDPGRLRQVIVNLGGNAVKFTERGIVSIRVMVDNDDDHAVSLTFEVADTGIGIPAGSEDRLFKSFSQVDGTITRRFGGTGLGLAISRELVELMGGSIGFSSSEGKGTVFSFSAQFQKTNVAPGEDAITSSAPAALKGVRVLVLDGNDEYRTFLVAALERWGCEALGVSNAERAIDALAAAAETGSPFTIALIDRFVHGTDGAETGTRIKSTPAIASTRLVLITAFGQRGDAAAFEKIGFSAYLTKPLRASPLRECIAMVACGNARANPLVTRHSLAETRKKRALVLVVEDNPTNQLVASKVLEKTGYQVAVVSGGQEAIEALRSRRFDLVLMDCQMPDMDGYEATGKIRGGAAGEENRGIPIIAMTANALQSDREKCIASGMDDFCTKPVNAEDLRDKIDNWIKRADGDFVFPEISAEPVPLPEKKDIVNEHTGAIPAFDRIGLIKRVMGDKELAESLVEAFCADIPLQITALQNVFNASDLNGVKMAAHRIKGAAANIGASALRALAAALESEVEGGRGETQVMNRLIMEIGERYKEFASEVRGGG